MSDMRRINWEIAQTNVFAHLSLKLRRTKTSNLSKTLEVEENGQKQYVSPWKEYIHECSSVSFHEETKTIVLKMSHNKSISSYHPHIHFMNIIHEYKSNLTKIRPLITLSHRGSDNTPLLTVFSAKYIDQSNRNFMCMKVSRKLWPYELSISASSGSSGLFNISLNSCAIWTSFSFVRIVYSLYWLCFSLCFKIFKPFFLVLFHALFHDLVLL